MSFTSPFAVLGVPQGASDYEIKKAYRRTLLQHHPDKLRQQQQKSSDNSTEPLLTIDEINLAYERIKENPNGNSSKGNNDDDSVVNFNEVVDLADLEESELPDGSMQWTRNCRCGGDGYLLFERDLELNGDADEIAVQCAGCSIFILVQYAVE